MCAGLKGDSRSPRGQGLTSVAGLNFPVFPRALEVKRAPGWAMVTTRFPWGGGQRVQGCEVANHKPTRDGRSGTLLWDPDPESSQEAELSRPQGLYKASAKLKGVILHAWVHWTRDGPPRAQGQGY